MFMILCSMFAAASFKKLLNLVLIAQILPILLDGG